MKKIAFVGLGNMGSGMASSIVRAGFDLRVWNRTASKMAPLQELGAETASSIRDAVEGADLVFTSLMDDGSVLDALNGDEGMLEGLARNAVHVCLTTVSPTLADSLKGIHEQHGSEFVMCPVLGRPDAAADGSLIALLAGSASGADKAAPVIESFTQMVFLLGAEPRHAAVLKLCLNYAVISNIELMSEVYACAEKSGLDLEQVEGFFRTLYGFPVLHMYAEKIRNRAFSDGGFKMTGGLKDIRLMLDSASQLGTSFDIGQIIESKMDEALTLGYEELDWSAIYEVTRRRADLDHA